VRDIVSTSSVLSEIELKQLERCAETAIAEGNVSTPGGVRLHSLVPPEAEWQDAAARARKQGDAYAKQVLRGELRTDPDDDARDAALAKSVRAIARHLPTLRGEEDAHRCYRIWAPSLMRWVQAGSGRDFAGWLERLDDLLSQACDERALADELGDESAGGSPRGQEALERLRAVIDSGGRALSGDDVKKLVLK
jgi:hypothetical protein